MKTLIVFMSKHGTTEKAANLLKEQLGNNETDLVNLGKEKTPNIALYDTVIVGGSIHAGSIQKGIKKFCRENKQILLTKKTGYFISCMEKSKKQQEFEAAFDQELRDKAVALGTFGGEFNFDKMNFFEKAIIKKISGFSSSVSDIDYDAIKEFASNFK
ncbi:MAG: flavodoxin domain-containing protein [Bacteroidales bacterium]|nr:flavodoxin domain-containing protein [Bacteroidales bacterium]HOY38497.1 flavodoxin domain-containing protein [Bacteroidales bacterium]